MPISKNTRRRYILIDSLLKRHNRYTLKEIAEKVNAQLIEEGIKPASLRMYYKDIENIQMEYPVSILKRPDGTYNYQSKEDSISNEILRQEDRAIIEMALQTFAIYKGSGLFDKFDDVITRMMAGTVLRGLDKNGHEKYIQISEAVDETGQKWIESIYEAIISYKSLNIHYQPFNQPVQVLKMSPYLLKEHRNIWYMVAYCKEENGSGATNVFKLTRIKKIEASTEDYYKDASFNKDDYFKYSLGVIHLHGQAPIEVKLKIKQRLIILISEHKLHPTMNIVSRSDEEIIITFTVYNTVELRSLILSFGAHAEVLEPEDLRNRISDTLEETFDQYF